MMLNQRLRALREAGQLSQEDIVARTGLPHAFVARVENGDEVPPLEALERWAAALGVPLRQLFHEMEAPLLNLRGRLTADEIAKGSSGNTTQGRRRQDPGEPGEASQTGRFVHCEGAAVFTCALISPLPFGVPQPVTRS